MPFGPYYSVIEALWKLDPSENRKSLENAQKSLQETYEWERRSAATNNPAAAKNPCYRCTNECGLTFSTYQLSKHKKVGGHVLPKGRPQKTSVMHVDYFD